MDVITFDYDKPYIREATDKYYEKLHAVEVKELSGEGPRFGFHFQWEVAVFVALAVVLFITVFLITASIVRRRDASSSSEAIAKDTKIIRISGAVAAVALLALVLITPRAVEASKAGRVSEPDYQTLLNKTVADNRGQIDEAVTLAADRAGINLEEACDNGMSRGPMQRGDNFSKRGNDRLIQCGGDEFGTLVSGYPDADEIRVIATSTGSETGTVIAASDVSSTREAATFSSVKFDGSDMTRYRSDFFGDSGWVVDNRGNGGRPFATEDEMTLEEARQARSE